MSLESVFANPPALVGVANKESGEEDKERSSNAGTISALLLSCLSILLHFYRIFSSKVDGYVDDGEDTEPLEDCGPGEAKNGASDGENEDHPHNALPNNGRKLRKSRKARRKKAPRSKKGKLRQQPCSEPPVIEREAPCIQLQDEDVPTLSSPEPPPAMEGENLEDGELEDGEIDEEVDEGPPQLSPQMPTEQQSHSDSDTEIEGEEKEKEKPPVPENKTEEKSAESDKEDVDNKESKKERKKRKRVKRKKHKEEKEKKKKKRARYCDHDQTDKQDSSASWPGQFSRSVSERSPPDPYESPDRQQGPPQGRKRSRSPPGPYDSPYESPPGPYDSPSDDDDYGPPAKVMRQSNKPQAQSMLSMLDSEYMDMDASVAASEKEAMFQNMGRGGGRGGMSMSRMKKMEKGRMYKEMQRQRVETKQKDKLKQRCKFFMEGKCAKGENCMFSHDFKPPRKTEVCKFYINDMCAKGDDCIYMHSDYPCKYFHKGEKCFQGDNCKFSHAPLNEQTMPIFEKISNEEEDFVTMVMSSPGKHVPKRNISGFPVPGPPKDGLKKIPSLFDIEVYPPGQGPSKSSSTNLSATSASETHGPPTPPVTSGSTAGILQPPGGMAGPLPRMGPPPLGLGPPPISMNRPPGPMGIMGGPPGLINSAGRMSLPPPHNSMRPRFYSEMNHLGRPPMGVSQQPGLLGPPPMLRPSRPPGMGMPPRMTPHPEGAGPRPPPPLGMEPNFYGSNVSDTNTTSVNSSGTGTSSNCIQSPEPEPRQTPQPNLEVQSVSEDQSSEDGSSLLGLGGSTPNPEDFDGIEFPAHLPPRQRELFMRIQQQQRQNMPEDQKNDPDTQKVEEDDNWYSSDEEDSGAPKSNLADILKTLQQAPTPRANARNGPPVSQPQPQSLPSQPAAMPFDIATMLSAIRNQTAPNQSPPTAQVPPMQPSNVPARDPRQAGRQTAPRSNDPRLLRNQGSQPEGQVQQPMQHQHPKLDDGAGSSSGGEGNLSPNHGSVIIHSNSNGGTSTGVPYTLHTIATSKPTLPANVKLTDPKFKDDPRIQRQLSHESRQHTDPRARPAPVQRQASVGDKQDPRMARTGTAHSGGLSPKQADPRSHRSPDPRMQKSNSLGGGPVRPLDPRSGKVLEPQQHEPHPKPVMRPVDPRARVQDPRMTRTMSAPTPTISVAPIPMGLPASLQQPPPLLKDPRQTRPLHLPAFNTGPRDSPPMPSLPPFIPPKPSTPLIAKPLSISPASSPKQEDGSTAEQLDKLAHRNDPRFKKKPKSAMSPSHPSTASSVEPRPTRNTDPRKGKFEHRSPLDAGGKSSSEQSSFNSFNRPPNQRMQQEQQQQQQQQQSNNKWNNSGPRRNNTGGETNSNTGHPGQPGVFPQRQMGMMQGQMPRPQGQMPRPQGQMGMMPGQMGMMQGQVPFPPQLMQQLPGGRLPPGLTPEQLAMANQAGVIDEVSLKDVFKTIDPTASPFC